MKNKCAIYNRYSINDEKKIIKHRQELINYCKQILKIDDFVLFEDIGSLTEERADFNEMMSRLNNGEFTDLLTYSFNRIYRIEYDRKIFNNIICDIASKNVNIHSILDRDKEYVSYIIKTNQ